MKTGKIFKNGQSQAVRLPKDFRFDGSEVYITRTGNIVHLIPCTGSWDSLFSSLEKFSEDFMEERAQPGFDNREKLS